MEQQKKKASTTRKPEKWAVQIRFGEVLYNEIKASAKSNHRSFNNEVIHRLIKQKEDAPT
jgi:hypothetical protein